MAKECRYMVDGPWLIADERIQIFEEVEKESGNVCAVCIHFAPKPNAHHFN